MWEFQSIQSRVKAPVHFFKSELKFQPSDLADSTGFSCNHNFVLQHINCNSGLIISSAQLGLHIGRNSHKVNPVEATAYSTYIYVFLF